jgi:uncharacterized membrane protein required for colicin V production
MSWMDIFLMLVVMGGLVFGWVQGLWRQGMTLAAFLAAIVLATYLQVFVTAWFGFISPQTPLVIRQTVAFLLLVGIIATVLDIVGRRLFPETRLAFLGVFDRLLGILVGFLTVCVQVSIAVLVFKFLARVSWPMGESLRLALVAGVDSSALVPVFYQVLVLLVSTVGPLLPEGIPRFLTIL